ncbi:MAG: tryptophan--tRNA ligase, partial [Candidatus Aminicenantales bacterium]
SAETIRQKIMPMITDTRRVRRSDPGEPNDCPVFTLHKAFVPTEKQEEIACGCRTAGIGCRDCKGVVLEYLFRFLEPVWERRRRFEENPGRIWEILDAGNAQARRAAQATMVEVRDALGF